MLFRSAATPGWRGRSTPTSRWRRCRKRCSLSQRRAPASKYWTLAAVAARPRLDIARAIGPSGRVAAFDISGPMLTEGQRRAEFAGIANIDWQEADPATAPLGGYDLLVSNFGVMFFGDPVAAFAHMCSAARPGARMVFVCWRPVTENPWMKVPMDAVSPHLPPRPKAVPHAPGMFAFADPERIAEVLTEIGRASCRERV